MTAVALVGCGLVGAKRAASLPPGVRVVSVFDVDEARAQRIASSLAPPAMLARSAEEAIGARPVDLVVVATTHRDLAAVATMAVERGRHVLLEKPGARRAEELRALRLAADAAGCLVRVGFNHRFHPAVRRLRQLMRGRDWGKLLWIRGRYGHGGRTGYEREWRTDPHLAGGGELLDQGVHLIDLVRHVVGEVDLAFAELRTDYWPVAVEDNAYLALRPRCGGFAWLHASWTEWKNLFSFEVTLQRAKLDIHGLGGSYGTERLTLYEMLPEMGPPLTTSWEWPFADDSWLLEMQDVIHQLQGGSAVGADLDDAIAVLDIVDRAYGR